MKSIYKILASLGLMLPSAGSWMWAAEEEPSNVCRTCRLPEGLQEYTIWPGTNSLGDVVFSGIPANAVFTNGSYYGWCIDYNTGVESAVVYHGLLYNSYSTNLPAILQGPSWDKINYLLNHKQGTPDQVQNAIWWLLGQTNAPTCDEAAQAMVDAAETNGAGFAPTNGQVYGVLVVPQEEVQRLLVETVCVPNVAPPALSPELRINSVKMTNELLVLRISGETGQAYVVEQSTNFVDWVPVTVLTNSAGTFEFTDTNSVAPSQRFYRAKKEQ